MQLFAPDTEQKAADTRQMQANAVYFRLIALWVFCEAMLGGIIHGFRLPVSGLVVGSCAVICIALIGWYAPARGAIIKATLIVAIFKMMLSPQAPVTAYIAVFFQGLLGELLFMNKKYYRAACLTLAVLALLESALQRVLVLTLVYGKDFWEVLNSSIYQLGGTQGTNYSYFIILWYVLLHLIVGILVGIWTGFLPQRIVLLDRLEKKYHIEPEAAGEIAVQKKKRKTIFQRIFFILWIGLLIIWLLSVFHIGKPLMPAHASLRILIRSTIIILTWYFLAGPLLKRWLQHWLQQKKNQSASYIQQVVEQLPFTRHLVMKSWKLSAGARGISRIFLCCRIILANTFHNVNA